MALIEGERLQRFLVAVKEHCKQQTKGLNPSVGGQETYDHGTYTGIEILANRISQGLESGEFEQHGPIKTYDGDIQQVSGKSRKLFVLGDKENGTGRTETLNGR